LIKQPLLLIVLLTVSCGTYFGSEGIIYNQSELKGFITHDVESQIEKNRIDAFEAGKSLGALPQAKQLDDGAITLVEPEVLLEASSGLITSVVPFAGTIGLIMTILLGVLKRRKEK
jgi:hypothetical protein